MNWSGWKRYFLQNVVIGVFTIVLFFVFFWSKEGIPYSHQVNRAWADVSFVLLGMTLIIGPLVRVATRFKFLVPWRRDIGVWFAFTAMIHVILLLDLHLDYKILRFFLDEDGALLTGVAHASNWIGLVALFQTFLLTITSNQFSEKILGPSSWKYLQQTVYTVFWLTIIHTYIFIYFLDDRKAFLFECISWSMIVLVLALQCWAFFYTIKIKKRQIGIQH